MEPDLETRVAQLEKLVLSMRQQLMGNNPSSNFRKLLESGGSTVGWFALTNNGVTVNINGATSPFPPNAGEGLNVLDVATQNSTVVTPFGFTALTALNAIPFDLENQTGAGILSMLNTVNGYTIIADTNTGLTVWDDQATPHNQHQTIIQSLGITTPDIVALTAEIGTITLTTPLPTTQGGTGTNYASFTALSNAVLAAGDYTGNAALAAEIASLQSQITANAADIATNTADIATLSANKADHGTYATNGVAFGALSTPI